MKKIFHLLTSLILVICIFSCTGYEPIFSSSNLEFKIADYSIAGEKKLGNRIYSKLYNLSKSSINNSNAKDIYILINASKNKSATAKNSAGKILGYKINLSTTVVIKDLKSGTQLLNENFNFSSSYKTQDLYSETKNLENTTIDNLIDKTYESLLIKLSESILKQ